MTKYCLVTHRIDTYIIDGPDPDRDPDKTPVNGRIIFTPMLGKGDSVIVTDTDGPRTVTLVPIEARITNSELYHRGEKGIKLFAGGGNANPEKVRYKASFHNMVAGTHPVTLRDVIFDAEPNGVINLAEVQPVAGTTGHGIIQGEPGITPHIGEDGTWWIGDTGTGVRAVGRDGSDGEDGAPGEVSLETLDTRIPETLALRRDTSVGTRIMAGDTMIFGDTGWRSVKPEGPGFTGEGVLLYRRVGSQVSVIFDGVGVVAGIGGHTYLTDTWSIPSGFRTTYGDRPSFILSNSNANPNYIMTIAQGSRYRYQNSTAASSNPGSGSSALQGQATWVTNEPWPSTLPGTPA